MTPVLDEEKLHGMMLKMVGDLGALVNGSLVVTGDQLGLYKALAQGGPMNSDELAQATGTAERYVREWLAAQAASGYVMYDGQTEKFHMTPEQSAVLAEEDSPFAMSGGFYSGCATVKGEPVLREAFKTGKGISWGDHDGCLFCGVARFFRPNYMQHLVQEWIPALDGVVEKLERGALVADVGCGFGLSTQFMAAAFPNSTFIGFDIHEPSVREAQRGAQEKGLTNVRYEVASAQSFAGQDFDFITTFDCLHDMGDPVGAAAHIRQALKNDGTWMIVEPFAHDKLEDNLNPIGQVYYGFSTTVCTPTSLSQDVGLALGAQAGEKRLGEVVRGGGFTTFRRALETPFNMVLEARP